MQTLHKKDSNTGIIGAVKLTFRNVKTGQEDVIHILNVFCDLGKNSIAERLAFQQSGKGKITYFATGTSSDVPNRYDHILGQELFRKPISVFAHNSNVATFTTYLSTSESNGTLTEIGLFGDDASSTPNSGELYAHTTINKVKTENDTLTIEWSITVN
jgi:hypothetical protein